MPQPDVALTSASLPIGGTRWAVGSVLEVEATTTGLAIPQIRFEGDVDADGPFWGGVGTATLLSAGTVEVVALSTFGTELTRETVTVVEPAQIGLGYVVRSWSESSPVVVLPDPLTLSVNTVLDVLSVAREVDGARLLGQFSTSIATQMGTHYPNEPYEHLFNLDVGTGTIQVDHDGEIGEFSLTVVEDDVVVDLEVQAYPGPEGEGRLDLTAVGYTSTGTPVHGLRPRWGNDDYETFVRAVDDNEAIEACVGTVCTVWSP